MVDKNSNNTDMQKDMNSLFEEDHDNSVGECAKNLLGQMVQKSQYVGEVYSLGYDNALVQVHDYYRKKVGGIPNLSFLIATRIAPDEIFNFREEDSSVILLRVIDSASLPNDAEKIKIRVEAAERSTGNENHWDSHDIMDSHTHQLLSYAGLKCRVIGTFFLDQEQSNPNNLRLFFGSDLSNFYPNRGLKVYKPSGDALKKIVNYQDINTDDPYSFHRTKIGQIRYASTHRSFQNIANVEFNITPLDFRGQKTALFGMTRTGKSNTTKILLKTLFELRFKENLSLRIGQIVFDLNGEYANENVQDANGENEPSAIKNVWKVNPGGKQEDVITYGLLSHPNDPNRRLTKINFYSGKEIQMGKELLNGVLEGDSSKYIKNFTNIEFISPDANDRPAMIRYKRRELAYHALLKKAGFNPGNKKPYTKYGNAGLFSQDLTGVMKKSSKYKYSADVLREESPSWDSLITALEKLIEFMEDKQSGYSDFEEKYIESSTSGDNWADDQLKTILTMFKYPNGSRQLAQAIVFHNHLVEKDYAEEIYQHLIDGKLVIIDQSQGSEMVNKSSAEKIMWTIFNKHKTKFGGSQAPEPVTVYIEEAHNLLPKGSEEDNTNVWARSAKEGGKFLLGMIYATQEVSSIQKNILKNTYNWFIAHLNNTDETREVSKYYDFKDFEGSILRAQDKGFIRVKMLSNPFVVPVQIDKFEV